jgi:hypothetical protein
MTNCHQKQQGRYLTVVILLFCLIEMGLLCVSLDTEDPFYSYLFFCPLLLSITSSYWKTRNWLETAQTTTGQITGYRLLKSFRSQYEVVDITFEAEQQPVEFEVYYSAFRTPPALNEYVDVLYNPANPCNARLLAHRWAPAWLWLVTSAVFIGIWVLMYFSLLYDNSNL